MTHPIMAPHLRQYRHNRDNSPSIFKPRDGFVAAYDKEGTDREIAALIAERDALVAHNRTLTSALKDAIDYDEGVEMYAGETSFYERCASLIEKAPSDHIADIKADLIYQVAVAIRTDIQNGVDPARACRTWVYSSQDIRNGKTWALARGEL